MKEDNPLVAKPPTTPENAIPLRQAVIAWKNQLAVIEDNAADGKKQVLNQMYRVVMECDEQVKTISKENLALQEEIDRLGRILIEHNLDPKPPKEFKNRAERRADQPKITKIE